jgi:hypothetical protein
MASRSVANPLFTRSSVTVTQNAPTNDPASSMATHNATNLLSSGRDVPLDSEGNEATSTQRINPATTPANASTLAKSTKKNKKKKKQSSTSSIKNKSKGKKSNPEDFYMKSVLTKRQAEMTKEHAEMTRAQAKVTNAKVCYMKQLNDLGLLFDEIEKMVDKEFAPIHATQSPNALADSNLEDLDSDDDSF